MSERCSHLLPHVFSLSFFSQELPVYGRRSPYAAGLPTSTEGVRVIRGAPRQQEQEPAGFHGGLPAQLRNFVLKMKVDGGI